MTCRPRSSVPLLALALLVVGCRRDARQGAATARGDSATTIPAGSADFRNPGSAAMTARAPATFRARFETSKGIFVIEVRRDWAPLGADRFYNLVKSGYYDGVRFFRVIPGFMAQFGIHGDPRVSAAWRDARIPDDPVRQRNARGMVTFATAGPGTRTTQLFINYRDNNPLDGMGFAPFGRVVEGMEVVDRLYGGYGEGAPGGRGPDQGRIQAEGNAYLERAFPELDQVRRATIVAP
jgi:peptidyl-prolyl cis-trans isomerase A (cyclophilin A)